MVVAAFPVVEFRRRSNAIPGTCPPRSLHRPAPDPRSVQQLLVGQGSWHSSVAPNTPGSGRRMHLGERLLPKRPRHSDGPTNRSRCTSRCSQPRPRPPPWKRFGPGVPKTRPTRRRTRIPHFRRRGGLHLGDVIVVSWVTSLSQVALTNYDTGQARSPTPLRRRHLPSSRETLPVVRQVGTPAPNRASGPTLRPIVGRFRGFRPIL